MADFLTKELHLPWPEARSILRDVYAEQISCATPKPRAGISNNLWESYRQTWPARQQTKETDWATQKAAEAKRRAEIRSAYLHERARIKVDLDKTPSERKAAYSLSSMRKAMEDARLYHDIALERHILREKHRAPGRDGYQRFLIVLASDGDASALTELRQRAVPDRSGPPSNSFSAEWELTPAMPASLSTMHYAVDLRGDVTYYADLEKTRAMLVDAGQFVQVLDESGRSVEAGLRLALQKFGSALDVHGTAEFRSQVLDVVLKAGLRVEFKDPTLAIELAQMKARSARVDAEEADGSRKTEQLVEAEFAGEAYDADDRRRWKEMGLDAAGDEEPTLAWTVRSRLVTPRP